MMPYMWTGAWDALVKLPVGHVRLSDHATDALGMVQRKEQPVDVTCAEPDVTASSRCAGVVAGPGVVDNVRPAAQPASAHIQTATTAL